MGLSHRLLVFLSFSIFFLPPLRVRESSRTLRLRRITRPTVLPRAFLATGKKDRRVER